MAKPFDPRWWCYVCEAWGNHDAVGHDEAVGGPEAYGDPPDDLELTKGKRDAAVVACAIALTALVDRREITDEGARHAVAALRRQTYYLGVLLGDEGGEAQEAGEDPLESKEIRPAPGTTPGTPGRRGGSLGAQGGPEKAC